MVFENFPIEMHGGMWRGDMKDYLQYSKYIIIMRKPNHMLDSVFLCFPMRECMSDVTSSHLCCLQFEFELKIKEFSLFLHISKEPWALKQKGIHQEVGESVELQSKI